MLCVFVLSNSATTQVVANVREERRVGSELTMAWFHSKAENVSNRV